MVRTLRLEKAATCPDSRSSFPSRRRSSPHPLTHDQERIFWRDGGRPKDLANLKVLGFHGTPQVRSRRARPAPRSCRRGPGRPWVAVSGEADLRPRRAVVGAQPSGRLMDLRLRPALLSARRVGVRQPFNEAGLTLAGCGRTIPAYRPDRSIAISAYAALAQAGQHGAGRVGEPARRSCDQFLNGRAIIALKQRNNTRPASSRRVEQIGRIGPGSIASGGRASLGSNLLTGWLPPIRVRERGKSLSSPASSQARRRVIGRDRFGARGGELERIGTPLNSSSRRQIGSLALALTSFTKPAEISLLPRSSRPKAPFRKPRPAKLANVKAHCAEGRSFYVPGSSYSRARPTSTSDVDLVCPPQRRRQAAVAAAPWPNRAFIALAAIV